MYYQKAIAAELMDLPPQRLTIMQSLACPYSPIHTTVLSLSRIPPPPAAWFHPQSQCKADITPPPHCTCKAFPGPLLWDEGYLFCLLGCPSCCCPLQLHPPQVCNRTGVTPASCPPKDHRYRARGRRGQTSGGEGARATRLGQQSPFGSSRRSPAPH